MSALLEPSMLGDELVLKNRVVMAPMTRTRTSDGDVPNALMATYYGQRAGAGLLITEAANISARGKGYARMPGVHTDAQLRGWQLVTDEVHHHGGTIFLQAFHVGRMAHTSMTPNGEAPWGVTDVRASESDVFAHDASGKLTFVRASTPRQIGTEEIPGVVDEFTRAFRNAKCAGFDGVEIHGGNGYLIDQFMNSVLNIRSDVYGGESLQSRTRFALEVVDAAIRELGAGRVGLRVSPFGRYNSMPADPQAEETLLYLCGELSRRGVGYLHVVYQLMPTGNMEDSEFNQTHLRHDLVRKIRAAFKGTVIWCGGFDKVTAQAALDTGCTDLIAFGRPFIGNPDLVARLANNWPIVEAHPSTYYTRNGEKGFTDFPNYDPRSRNISARSHDILEIGGG